VAWLHHGLVDQQQQGGQGSGDQACPRLEARPEVGEDATARDPAEDRQQRDDHQRLGGHRRVLPPGGQTQALGIADATRIIEAAGARNGRLAADDQVPPGVVRFDRREPRLARDRDEREQEAQQRQEQHPWADRPSHRRAVDHNASIGRTALRQSPFPATPPSSINLINTAQRFLVGW
jgi:hypothetical protein